MRTYTVIAVILIVLGIAAFVWQGLSYTTTEKVVDLGPIQVTAEEMRTLPLYRRSREAFAQKTVRE